MRLWPIGARGLALAVVGVVWWLPQPAHAGELVDEVDSLPVVAEQRSGYDRDLFGDYDRQALLRDNFADWPRCDGYYSFGDDRCYTDAGEVDVDHIVALAEAWDSGAHAWDRTRLDRFAGDRDNLWLLTDDLNRSKSDSDVAGWLPPHDAAVCPYLQRYVAVKLEWGLSVDRAEKTVLLQVAGGCDDDEPAGRATTVPPATPPGEDTPRPTGTAEASGQATPTAAALSGEDPAPAVAGQRSGRDGPGTGVLVTGVLLFTLGAGGVGVGVRRMATAGPSLTLRNGRGGVLVTLAGGVLILAAVILIVAGP